MMYIVKSVVCDYGVYEKSVFNNKEKLIVICNSLSNAELIADILNTDLGNTKYAVIKTSKIDKAIEEMDSIDLNEYADNTYQLVNKCIEILKRNIGENKETE